MHLPYPGTRRQALPALMVVVAAPVAIAAVWLLTRNFIPAEIPSSPTMLGSVSEPESTDRLVLRSLALVGPAAAIVGVLFLLGVWKGRFRWLSWAIPFVWISAAFTISSLVGALGTDSYEEAAARDWPWVLSMCVGAIVILASTVLVRPMPATTSKQPLPESSLRLTASERAVFIGSATSTAKLVVAAVITLIGVGLTASNAAFLIVVVYGLLWANTSTVQIRIDDAGVLVRPRWIKWTVFRTPLSEIALARVARHQTAWQELEHPDERPRSKVVKVRIRPGPAIELVLHDEKSVSISLDQAEQAADVLNALIVRHRTAKDPTLTSQ